MPRSITAMSKLSQRTFVYSRRALMATFANLCKKILPRKKIQTARIQSCGVISPSRWVFLKTTLLAARRFPARKRWCKPTARFAAIGPVAEAVAALYAYESQVPEIATTKIEGLKTFYGITNPEALAYFTVHEEADKAHRAAWRNWLEQHADGDSDGIMATTDDALNALWGALDAVHCPQSCAQN